MNKSAIALSMASVIACGVALKPINTKAYENDSPYTDDNTVDRTVGLIAKYSLSVSKSGGNLTISGQTKSNSIMASIGFINISIQRSSNGSSWTEEKTITNKLKSNSTSHTLSDYSVTVVGGYYYRVVCDHYADNGSGTTQRVSQTSNSVWIS